MTSSLPGLADPYPVRLDIPYPTHLSRGLIFVKWLLALPHLALFYVVAIASYVVWFIAFFAILFTGRYPRGLFKVSVGLNRYLVNVFSYVWLLRDEYPPFSLEAGRHPASLDVDYPPRLSRWLLFVKWLLSIPHQLAVFFLVLAVVVTTWIAWWAILFTGKYPQTLFDFAVGVRRYNERVGSYMAFLTDKYPPFSLSGSPRRRGADVLFRS